MPSVKTPHTAQGHAARKVTGEGSVVQLEKDRPRGKCRKWQLRVPVGRDPRTGKYRTRTRRMSGTYTEAKRQLRAFIDEIEGGRSTFRATQTLAEWAEEYMAAREARGEVTPMTLKCQRSNLRKACGRIGGVRLDEVTPEVVKGMLDDLRGGKTPSGRPYATSTLRVVFVSVKLALDAAVEAGLIESNPCAQVKSPSAQAGEKRAMDQEAVKGFVANLDPTEPCELAALLAVSTGLRRGEVCGLSWEDVDLQRGELHVRHSYDSLGNLKPPKTRAGRRILPMSDALADALAKAKEAQASWLEERAACKRRELAGEHGHDDAAVASAMAEAFAGAPHGPWAGQDGSTAVVLNARGMRARPEDVNHWWNRDREGLGAAGFTFHELRHTYLTLLAQSGAHPKVMQELAGHTRPDITMQIYTHVNMDAKRGAVDAMAKLL